MGLAAAVIASGCTGTSGEPSPTVAATPPVSSVAPPPAASTTPLSDPDVSSFQCERIINESWPADEANIRVRATITNHGPDAVSYLLSYDILDSTGTIIGFGAVDTGVLRGAPLAPGKTLKVDDVFGVMSGAEQVVAAGPHPPCELSRVERRVE